jgi:sigma-B regulation protein RsbU (phosphoserine phosphatase)
MSKTTPKLLLIEKASACAPLLMPGVFELVRAEHLAAGLEKLNAHSYDLILMDLVLPDSQGLIAFNQIHAATPQTPVIVLAEVAEEEIAARTIALGAQDYLLKPQLTAPALNAAVRKALDRHYFQLSHNHEGFLLQTLMNSIPDAVYFKDTRSRFLMISRALARKHHLTDPQQAVGKCDADYFTKPHAEQALADEQAILRTGQPLEGIEESETWPDGSITWVSTTKMPLRNSSGRLIGTFGISRDITIRKLAELALAEQTRQLHKKNQQIEEELKMARELQLAMLPQSFPAVFCDGAEAEALKFYSYYIPSGAVSGDFYDVFPLSDTAVGIFICDVMGHDVRAALVTAMLRALVEDLSLKAANPGQLLTEINLALFKVFRQAGTTMYATAFYLVADVATGQLSYASAAHPNQLQLKRPAGKVDVLGPDAGGNKGPALGLFRDSQFPTYQRPMHAKDLLVFFTDGLIEEAGQHDEIFSQERLAEIIASLRTLPPKELLAKTLDAIRDFCGHQEFSDDVCLLGVEVKRLKTEK